jgi:muramoyltetrapeptide carboxypeptidase
MEFAKPVRIRTGDRVRIVAPGGPFDLDSFNAGIEVLKTRYEPKFDQSIFAVDRYLAGDDHRRHAELTSAFLEPDTKAIFCARGGYGSMRLLPQLPVSTLPLKPFVGFSDMTALHLAFQAAGRITFHGPVVTQLGKQPKSVISRLFLLLESADPLPPLPGDRCFVPGTVEGPLLGGNLSVLSRLLGTPYFPDMRGAILLLEDVGEKPYRVDRMWTHLALAGVFRQVAGIVLGDFTKCEEDGVDYDCREILRGLAMDSGLPCAAGFAIGHGEANFAVPLGAKVRLDAERAVLEFLEPATVAGPESAP